jgi:hypothetical protein
VACLSGTVWNHVYRQAVTLDEGYVITRSIRGDRIHIPDQAYSGGDPFKGSP